MSIDKTLEDRQKQYGDFSERAATTQRMKVILRQQEGFKACSPAQREALEMIVVKIARILSGDPNHLDSWHDIQGYAKLAEDDIRKHLCSTSLPSWQEPSSAPMPIASSGRNSKAPFLY